MYSNLLSWGRKDFATLIHDSTHARLVFLICALNSGQSCLSCPMWISISRNDATCVLISISICEEKSFRVIHECHGRTGWCAAMHINDAPIALSTRHDAVSFSQKLFADLYHKLSMLLHTLIAKTSLLTFGKFGLSNSIALGCCYIVSLSQA
jgi:hypothetical protein